MGNFDLSQLRTTACGAPPATRNLTHQDPASATRPYGDAKAIIEDHAPTIIWNRAAQLEFSTGG